jgi:LPS export ABC transporter protein LptC
LHGAKVDRLAGRILGVVALFVLVVAGILVARTRTVQTEPVGPQPSLADLSIKEVQLREESAGGSRWHLTADQASVFEADGRTALRKVRVRVWDRQRAWSIVGEEGDFFKATRNLEIRHNVVMLSDDGLRLETSILRWDGAGRRLWTDVPVRIVRRGAVIDGRALDVHTAEEATTVQGRVRATFTSEPRP